MSEDPRSDLSRSELPHTPTRTQVIEQLADAVLTVPGVIRLEPSVRSRFRVGAGVDGVTVRVRDGVADVEVEIATHTQISARTTAERVEARVADVLTQAGYVCGSIAVRVLAVERT